MKKVLVLATTFPRWKDDTTRSFVYELERRLTDHFELFVLAPHHEGAKLKEEMSRLKVKRHVYFWPERMQQLCYEGGILPALKKKKWLYLQALTLIGSQMAEAIKLVRKEKIKLVHAHWVFPQGLTAWAIKKMFGIPYIVTSHGSDVYGLNQKVMSLIKKKVFNEADVITVVSKDMEERVRKEMECEARVLPMGVDSGKFHPDNKDNKVREALGAKGPLLLFVGRLVEGKGLTYLIEAMEKVKGEIPGVKLAIIGNGPEEIKLRKLTKKLDLEKEVIFLGAKAHDQLPVYYASADIFISPSVVTKESSEGFGLTLVEAGFSGCVPIGTNVGGIKDIIQEGESGFMVPERDPEAIAKKVIELCKNPKEMDKIKTNCRKTMVTKFDWKRISHEYGKIYISLT